MKSFLIKYRSEDLTDTEKDDDIQVKMDIENIKRYLNKEDKVKISLNKLFNVI